MAFWDDWFNQVSDAGGTAAPPGSKIEEPAGQAADAAGGGFSIGQPFINDPGLYNDPLSSNPSDPTNPNSFGFGAQGFSPQAQAYSTQFAQNSANAQVAAAPTLQRTSIDFSGGGNTGGTYAPAPPPSATPLATRPTPPAPLWQTNPAAYNAQAPTTYAGGASGQAPPPMGQQLPAGIDPKAVAADPQGYAAWQAKAAAANGGSPPAPPTPGAAPAGLPAFGTGLSGGTYMPPSGMVSRSGTAPAGLQFPGMPAPGAAPAAPAHAPMAPMPGAAPAGAQPFGAGLGAPAYKAPTLTPQTPAQLGGGSAPLTAPAMTAALARQPPPTSVLRPQTGAQLGAINGSRPMTEGALNTALQGQPAPTDPTRPPGGPPPAGGSMFNNPTYKQALATAGQQGSYADTLRADMAGKAPSLAQAQLQQGTDANIQAANALAASGGQGNYAAAARQAAQGAATAGQALAGQTAALRANEYQSARGELGTALTNQRAQDLTNQGMSYQNAIAQAQLEADQNKTQATLQQNQNALNQQGALAWNGASMGVLSQDDAAKQHYLDLMAQRYGVDKGVAIQQQQINNAQTAQWLGMGLQGASILAAA